MLEEVAAVFWDLVFSDESFSLTCVLFSGLREVKSFEKIKLFCV